MAKIRLDYSGAMALILPLLKDIVHFVFYGYTMTTHIFDIFLSIYLPASYQHFALALYMRGDSYFNISVNCLFVSLYIWIFCLCVYLDLEECPTLFAFNSIFFPPLRIRVILCDQLSKCIQVFIVPGSIHSKKNTISLGSKFYVFFSLRAFPYIC